MIGAMPLSVGLVGPLPPPEGGMANQCRQLSALLADDGVVAEIVRTNAPYRPAWIGRVRVLRALFRIVPFLTELWSAAGRVHVVHVFANSGWAWHLFAAPAVWIARLRGTPVIVNYRGGGAEAFLAGHPPLVARTLAMADALVVPSGFLVDVFRRFGLAAKTIPNIVDLARFAPGAARVTPPFHVVVTRNLEPIYDIGTAIEALAHVVARGGDARMTVAGVGPERAALEALARSLPIADRVTFAGRVEAERIGALYRGADVMVNPSTVDNMPNAVLEAFAAGVPVVSTDVGGIPHIAHHERTALLVPPRDAVAMGDAMLRVMNDPALRAHLTRNGVEEAKRYAWPQVRALWLDQYRALALRDKRMAEAQ